ncbi:unnamed protein product, partial [Closterium sp. NIES-54]
MGGATGEDGEKVETTHEAGVNAGSGATAHGAGENAGGGATAHKAEEERGEGAKAHETGEERGEGATVHGVMREGMAVLIDVNGEKASFAMLQRNSTVRVGKQQCSLAPLIGCPFGSVFELRMGGEEGARGGGGEGGGGEGEGREGGKGKDAGGEGEDDKGDGGKGGRGKWGGRGGGRGGGGRGGGRGGRRPQLVRVSKEQLREGGYSHAAIGEVDAAAAVTPAATAAADTAADTAAAEAAKGGAADTSAEGVKDNRNLIDDNTAQKLSANEIEALKRQAASGHEVVRALAANSVSFHTKTDFAQEKYLRKKQKKHAPRLVARFPTADSVCEAYFAKAPARIGFLRPDSLAMLLAMANVGAHSHLLVLDGTGGLITAAAAQRMGGHGAICSAFYASHVSHAPSIDIIRHLNLSLPAAAIIHRASVQRLLDAHHTWSQQQQQQQQHTAAADVPQTAEAVAAVAASDDPAVAVVAGNGTAITEAAAAADGQTAVGVEGEEAEERPCKRQKGEGDESAAQTGSEGAAGAEGEKKAADGVDGLNAVSEASAVEKMEVEEETEGVREGAEGVREGADGVRSGKSSLTREERGAQGALGRVASSEVMQQWLKEHGGFSSLIVAAPALCPSAVLQQLLPLLQPSAAFVLHHTTLQPLAEAMREARSSAVALELSEPWLREYQ